MYKAMRKTNKKEYTTQLTQLINDLPKEKIKNKNNIPAHNNIVGRGKKARKDDKHKTNNTHTHTRTHARAQTHVHKHTQTHAHTHTHTYTHTNTHTRTHTHTHTHREHHKHTHPETEKAERKLHRLTKQKLTSRAVCVRTYISYHGVRKLHVMVLLRFTLHNQKHLSPIDPSCFALLSKAQLNHSLKVRSPA